MTLRVRALTISNVGCFTKITIRFGSDFNIVCGENGVGKTTILDCLAGMFSFDEQALSHNANAPFGEIELSAELGGKTDALSSAKVPVHRWYQTRT